MNKILLMTLLATSTIINAAAKPHDDSDSIAPESPRSVAQTTMPASAPEAVDEDFSTQVEILMCLEGNQDLVQKVLKAVGDRTYTPATATAQLKAINEAITPMTWQLRTAFLKHIGQN